MGWSLPRLVSLVCQTNSVIMTRYARHDTIQTWSLQLRYPQLVPNPVQLSYLRRDELEIRGLTPICAHRWT